MKKYTHLIAGGCSFTTTEGINNKNWPLYAAKQLECDLYNTAATSQGNGLIAARLIHGIHDLLLQGVSPESMLVGIVWSGVDRMEFFHAHAGPPIANESFIRRFLHSDERGDCYPSIADEHGYWEIANAFFDTPRSTLWYENFHNDVGSVIRTYEKIHWVQCFLENHNIDYFMSTYTNYVLEHGFDDNEYVKWIRDSINYDKFLPDRSLHETFNPDAEGHMYGVMDHPDPQQSENFALNHVVPFVERMYG